MQFFVGFFFFFGPSALVHRTEGVFCVRRYWLEASGWIASHRHPSSGLATEQVSVAERTCPQRDKEEIDYRSLVRFLALVLLIL